jgi:hypothetical protein
MKTLITFLFIMLTSCGGTEENTANTKTYPCDSQIVAVMATMTTPNVLGLGEPDTTTYTTSGQNHVLIYEFKLARQTITFEYNTNYCGETVIKW